MNSSEAAVRPPLSALFTSWEQTREPRQNALGRLLQADCRELQASARRLPNGVLNNGILSTVSPDYVGMHFVMSDKFEDIRPTGKISAYGDWKINFALPKETPVPNARIRMNRMTKTGSEEKEFIFPISYSQPIDEVMMVVKDTGQKPAQQGRIDMLSSITRKLIPLVNANLSERRD